MILDSSFAYVLISKFHYCLVTYLLDTFAYYLRVLILHPLLACCVSSRFLYIVTRATTGERKLNGSLPKLRGVPYEFWGYKRNKNKIKLIPPDSTTRKELMKPCCNTLLVRHLKHWLLPSYVCLTALNDRL